jgi:ribosomal protein L34E
METPKEKKEPSCPHCGCDKMLGDGTKDGRFIGQNYVGLLAEDRCAQCGHILNGEQAK